MSRNLLLKTETKSLSCLYSVHSLLHVLVVVHPLLDVIAQSVQLRQLLLNVLRHLHLLQIHHPFVQDRNSSLQTLLGIDKVLAMSLGNTQLIMCLSDGPGYKST